MFNITVTQHMNLRIHKIFGYFIWLYSIWDIWSLLNNGGPVLPTRLFRSQNLLPQPYLYCWWMYHCQISKCLMILLRRECYLAISRLVKLEKKLFPTVKTFFSLRLICWQMSNKAVQRNLVNGHKKLYTAFNAK